MICHTAPGGIQNPHRSLKSDENRDAHNQGQNRNGGASRASLQIEPGVKRLEIMDFLFLPASALDFHFAACHRNSGSYPRRVLCRRQGGNHGKDQRNGGAGQQEQALATAIF